jgi:S-formylglutathione hydrolase FrmB
MKNGLSVCSLLLVGILLFSAACKRQPKDAPPDHPRLTPNVVMRDVEFRSAALNRTMRYRVVLPAVVFGEDKLPTLYLLHGGGGGFRDWSNYSNVAGYAGKGFILVMPEGDESYYMNAAERPQDRYEDYIVHDLIADVESKFPVSSTRSMRAIAGVSMGGFGAVKLALGHTDLFVFAAGISPAIDVPSRPFSVKRISQWRHHSSIFGDWGSRTRHDDDPFVLARKVDPSGIPYLFLTCGDKEGLLPANRNFAALLGERHFQYEFHVVKGGHDWNQWNAEIPGLFQSLMGHIGSNN